MPAERSAPGSETASLLQLVGRWWMLARAWMVRDTLSAAEQADLRAALGWPVPTAEVRAGEVVSGTWLVAGAHRDLEGRLQQQRTWLRGEDGEHVVLLETAGPGSTLGTPQLAGTRLQATVALYPGSSPRRALFVDPAIPLAPSRDLGAATDIASALTAVSAHLADAPWRDRFPATLGDVSIAAGQDPTVVDAAGDALPDSSRHRPHCAARADRRGAVQRVRRDRGRTVPHPLARHRW